MTRQWTRSPAWIAHVAAVPALTLAVGAQAQVSGSVQDFSLPPSAPSPAPAPAGPVDSDHPVIAQTRPAPTPAPEALPSAAIVLPAPMPDTALRAERAAPASPQKPVRAVPTAPVATAPTPPAVPAIDPIVTARAPAPAPVPTLAPAGSVASGRSLTWIGIASGAVVVMLLAVLIARRRRPIATRKAPYGPTKYQDSPDQLSPPATRPPPAVLDRKPPPTPDLPVTLPALDLQFEARHLSRALVNASLAYRLTLTNHGAVPIGPLRIAGDIISAHATLPASQQLYPDMAALATIHEVQALPPGEAISLGGELRLPIASILPIHCGAARLFVPLVRFRVEADSRFVSTRVFVVGRASERPGATLRPFPLDQGPGVERAIGHRAVARTA